MLVQLNIRDFVIVRECHIDFGGGFTVFSGETGAGKSILIDALALALGAKTDAGVVREGASRTDISATFDTPAEADAWLAEHELAADPGTVLLRRTVDAQGRSKAWINGTSVTQAQLRECGNFLVDIHGQHAHQLLLKPSAQRELLDAHAGLEPQARAVAEAWRHWQTVRRQREEFERDASRVEVERERLQWQFDELSRLAPRAGEWDEVSAEHRRLSHAASLIEGAQGASAVLADEEGAARDLIGQALGKLQPLAAIDPALANAVQALTDADSAIGDAVSTLHAYLARIDVDPARLAELDARMDALHSTARKYRVKPEELPAEFERIEARLREMGESADAEALARREAEALAAFVKPARALGAARRKAGELLSREVSEAMQTLAMVGGSFDVRFAERAEAEGTSHGLEDVEFYVSGHAGVALRPLAKVASGGELARISLAIAAIATGATAPPTLIFDEVDTGIGGAVAEVVGKLLQGLGTQRQVLCVTHLPQVAAKGDTHFAVAKATHEGQTVSQVTPLDAHARVEEIARMLGGVEITPATRRAARELIAR
ncbi:DNA repair protein RecN [Derxia gummosa]|uniref:DNA repair protein RecN n=1 Tax=Derxia gummosa DSM 723 TaxID=1121388 RepID=A0A8B6X664_9BURK|nr:DNA repair protein RecN [Derxia gummosa]